MLCWQVATEANTNSRAAKAIMLGIKWSLRNINRKPPKLIRHRSTPNCSDIQESEDLGLAASAQRWRAAHRSLAENARDFGCSSQTIIGLGQKQKPLADLSSFG